MRNNAVNADGILALLASFTEALVGTEPEELSLLFVLAYVASAGNATNTGTFERLFNVRGGAQQSRLVGGSQLVAQRVAAALGRRVHLNAPVRRIVQNAKGVTVTADGLTAVGKRVVVALPTPLAARIDYAPLLPAARDLLSQRLSMGALMKVEAVYPTPFWRASRASPASSSPSAGRSGTPSTTRRPTARPAFSPDSSAVPRTSTGDPAPPPPAARPCSPSTPGCSRTTGSCPRRSTSRWTGRASTWSRGGPTVVAAPGVLTHYGPALRAPVGRIHWAGTETSDYWQGYMDGAVRSGERVSAEVRALL